MTSIRSSVVAALALAIFSCAREETPEGERLRSFEEMMADVRLVGSSTSFAEEGITGSEEYAIESASHVGGDKWLLHATLRLGSREMTVPIPVDVLWAGDTPVITLTDLSIPGLGSYSARVLLFRGHYAGSWTSNEGGGHVFGEIVPRRD